METQKICLMLVKLLAKKKVNKIIKFTGFNNDNPLSKSGDINIWANSSVYNIVENTHQLWLLSLVDLINEQKK